jgi:hypothetical protein
VYFETYNKEWKDIAVKGNTIQRYVNIDIKAFEKSIFNFLNKYKQQQNETNSK